jgi:hypothetical protein
LTRKSPLEALFPEASRVPDKRLRANPPGDARIEQVERQSRAAPEPSKQSSQVR